MAFGNVSQTRKKLSEVVAGVSDFGSENGVDYHYATVAMEAINTAAAVATETMGMVVKWNNTDASYQAVGGASATSPTTTIGTAPGGEELGVVVGNAFVGDNEEDITLSETVPVNVVVLFRGPAAVKSSGLVFDATTSGTTVANHEAALERIGIAVITSADATLTSHLG